MKKKQQIITEEVKITPPNIKMGEVWIHGTAPLVIHAFPDKAKRMIKEKQMAGSTAKKNVKKEARNFEKDFQEARHISFGGWDGIPATAFKNACIQACALVGFTKALTKITLFVEADDYDRNSGDGLVKIYGGEPEVFESMVKVGTFPKVADVCVRPRWLEWGAKLRIKYDADILTASDVANLVARAGLQIGVCEGRPGSSSSAGMGWGTFEISDKKTVEGLLKKKARK